MLNDKTLVRYSTPGKYDVAKFGTISKVMGDNDSFEFYVQLSEDESIGNWQKISYLLEKVFGQFIINNDFLAQCLNIYVEKEDKHSAFDKISEIIKE